jgi:ribosome-associated toxin RatA of RatAB toxin-antitoxin module
MRYAIAITLGLGLLAAAPIDARADLKSALMQGQIVAISVPGYRGVKPGRAMGIVDAPAELVTQIIARFDKYREFVPRITGSRRVKPDRFVVRSKMPWPVSHTWVYLRLQRGVKKGVHTLQWRMENGTLKKYEGVAWIQPYGKSRALLTYQMLAVPHTVAPNALLSYGMREAAKSMVQAVRKRASKIVAQRRNAPGTRVASQ